MDCFGKQGNAGRLNASGVFSNGLSGNYRFMTLRHAPSGSCSMKRPGASCPVGRQSGVSSLEADFSPARAAVERIPVDVVGPFGGEQAVRQGHTAMGFSGKSAEVAPCFCPAKVGKRLVP